jgi:outer membrane protein assembly factor BamB
MILCSLGMFMTISAKSQWSQWRGPSRDGASTETNLLKNWPAEGPRLVWSVDTVGDGFSSAVIEDQMVYTVGKRDSVEIITALDLKGNIKWQKPVGRALQSGDWQQSRCTPAVYNNKVYAITSIGDIACFDARSGKINWKKKIFENVGGTFGPMAESPLVIDNKIFVTPCGKQTTMMALDRLSGKTLWQTESLDDSAYFSSPVIIRHNNKNLIFQSTNRHDMLVDCSTGKILWSDNRISGMIPQVYSNHVYYTGDGTKGGTLTGWDVNLKSRQIIWKDTVKALEISGAAVIDKNIVVSGLPRGIVCIDLTTGKPLSRYNRVRTCNFIVADKMLYCYEDGTARVYMFNMENGKFDLRGSFKAASGSGPSIAHMALANGMLFIRHGRVLMAYDLKS